MVRLLLLIWGLCLLPACGQRDAVPVASPPPAVSLTVYKDAQCGCCGDWITHLEQAGMTVSAEDREDMADIKQRHGVPSRYRSCHTAVDAASGYVFEGHIPAALVQRFVTEKPEGAIGLTVPGMPVGSPGMEMGERFEPYDVLLLKADGTTSVYAHIASADQQ